MVLQLVVFLTTLISVSFNPLHSSPQTGKAWVNTLRQLDSFAHFCEPSEYTYKKEDHSKEIPSASLLTSYMLGKVLDLALKPNWRVVSMEVKDLVIWAECQGKELTVYVFKLWNCRFDTNDVQIQLEPFFSLE